MRHSPKGTVMRHGHCKAQATDMISGVTSMAPTDKVTPSITLNEKGTARGQRMVVLR